MPIKIFITCVVVLLCPLQALAYVGPGLGLGAIGAILGIILSVILGILGLVWYPLKRMFNKGHKRA